VRITAELPGLDEKGRQARKSQTAYFRSPARRKTESEDKAPSFSASGTRARFERHIPLQDIEEDSVSWSLGRRTLAFSFNLEVAVLLRGTSQ